MKELCYRCKRPTYFNDKMGPLKEGVLFHKGRRDKEQSDQAPNSLFVKEGSLPGFGASTAITPVQDASNVGFAEPDSRSKLTSITATTLRIWKFTALATSHRRAHTTLFRTAPTSSTPPRPKGNGTKAPCSVEACPPTKRPTTAHPNAPIINTAFFLTTSFTTTFSLVLSLFRPPP